MKVLAVLLLLGAVEAGGYNSLLNFPGPDNTENYVVPKTNILYVSAFTVCTWVLKDTDYVGGKFFFSYATKSTANDEFDIGEYHNKWYVESYNDGYLGRVSAYSDETVVRGQWYHTCFTLSASSKEISVFVNGHGTTTKHRSTRFRVGGGVLVIGQEQDTLGGGFDDTQSFIGQLYNLNFWNRVLSAAEIMDMYKGGFCEILSSAVSKGVIISWDDIVAGEMKGAVSLRDARCTLPRANCM